MIASPENRNVTFLKTASFHFWGMFLGKGRMFRTTGGLTKLRKKNFKGRCEKRKLSKCIEVCRTYDPIQFTYADILSTDDTIQELKCNVPLDDLGYTTDFVCTKVGGDLMVRECVSRKHLTKPLTIKLLDTSREYWLRRGVADWGLVIDEEV